METLPFPPARYPAFIMPKASKRKPTHLPPSETPRQRLARPRCERGFTRVEPAEKTGLVQTLVSDSERGKLRLNADRILRFAAAREVSTDALLQPAGPVESKKPSCKVVRRLEQVGALLRRRHSSGRSRRARCPEGLRRQPL